MNFITVLLRRNCRVALVLSVMALLGLARVSAQPTVSVVPPDGASDVSPSAAIVFTFSEQMDTGLTSAQFYRASPFTPLTVSSVWSGANNVLTCTPSPAFPSGELIFWTVDGENLPGDPLEGDGFGFFNTSGGAAPGTGTNKLTAFSVGKVHLYNQTSAAAPTLDPDVPYSFAATTVLSSNRSANSVTLTLPTSAVSNLTQNIFAPESFFLFSSGTNLSAFNATFPFGNYSFTVISTTNQIVTVNLPVGFVQPAAPHTTSWAAAQAVNAALPFQLNWDAFPGGTAADYIYVSIGEAFKTPTPGTVGALNGTATSVTIPAGTLQAGTSYDATIGFYRAATTSNSSYTTSAYLATSTDFNLVTTGGAGSLVLTNASRAGGLTSFDVKSATGQNFTVEYSVTMLTNEWQTMVTTNSASGLLRINHSATNQYLFYRARKNP